MEEAPPPLHSRPLKNAANAAAGAALATGLLVAVAGAGRLRVAEAGFVPGMAVGLYLLMFGAAFLLHQLPSHRVRLAAAALLGVSLLLPLVAGIAGEVLPPERFAFDMSPADALLATLCSLALAALWERASRAAWLGQGLAIAAACALFVFVAGQIFGDVRLIELHRPMSVSRFSVIGFTLCIAGLLLHRPETGAVHLFVSDNAAGALLRRQTVPVMLVPLAVAWVIDAAGIGQARGVELALALVAIGTVFMLLVLMSVHALSIERLDASRATLHKTLLGTERDFRLLVERIANHAVFMIDGRGRIASWNAGAERLYGYAAGDVVGEDYAKVFTAADQAPQLLKHLLDTAAAAGQATQTGRCVRKDGSRFVATISLTAVRDEDGSLRGFSNITQDVTEQKLAQAEREELLLRLQTLIDTASEAIVVTDAGGVIESFNPAAEGMFGYRAHEAAGRNIAMLTPEEAGEPNCLQQTPRIANRQLEIEGRHKNGELFPIEVTISEMQISGEVKFTVLARDITARKQAEDALRESEERLKLAVEGGELGTWDVDLKTGKRTCSPLIWRMLGYEPGAADSPASIGMGLLHPDDHDRISCAFDNFVSEQAPHYDEEFRLRTKSGKWLWVLSRARIVRRDAAGAPLLVSGVQLDISGRKQAEEVARIVALHDALTGLPNRALIYEFGEHMVSAARRAHHKLAVLFIDLDRFKQVNDTYGHQAGDDLLKEVSHRIRRSVRGEDLAGRLAGDEFVVILSPVRSEHDVTQAAAKVLQAVGAPYRCGEVALQVSPSIGIALYPNDAAAIETLIHHADAAMYIAKQRGRNNYQFYTAEVSQRARRAQIVERELRDGVDHAEFRLCYQPIVSTADRQVTGTEALLRWRHEGSERPARDFLATAEAAGLMGTIGDWSIAEACRQQARWRDDGMQPIQVAINIWPTQFRQYNFVERLRRMLAEAGADPAQIELELAEAAFEGHIDDAVATLARLKDIGLQVCVDGFGSRLSLSELSRLPVDKIKLGRALVAAIDDDPHALAVVEAAIAIGHKLGFRVAVAGIESARASRLMTERACDLLQGNLIGEPIGADRFAGWLRAAHGDVAVPTLH